MKCNEVRRIWLDCDDLRFSKSTQEIRCRIPNVRTAVDHETDIPHVVEATIFAVDEDLDEDLLVTRLCAYKQRMVCKRGSNGERGAFISETASQALELEPHPS